MQLMDWAKTTAACLLLECEGRKCEGEHCEPANPWNKPARRHLKHAKQPGKHTAIQPDDDDGIYNALIPALSRAKL
jgi:hypothetical protein